MNKCKVVPSLLIPLMSSHKPLREGALNCLAIIQQAIQSKTSKQPLIGSSPFIYLLEKIMESKLELVTDPSYLQQLFGGVLSDERQNDVTETPSKRKRRRRMSGQSSEEKEVENRAKALECLLMHVVAMGAPAYVQHMLLSALEYVQHAVSGSDLSHTYTTKVIHCLFCFLGEVCQRTATLGATFGEVYRSSQSTPSRCRVNGYWWPAITDCCSHKAFPSFRSWVPHLETVYRYLCAQNGCSSSD